MEALGGRGIQLIIVLDLGTTSPPGKGDLVSIVQEAGWAPVPVWMQMLEEKSFAYLNGTGGILSRG
jgi:hypothetical protein